MLARHSLSLLLFVALAYSGPLVGRNGYCNTGKMCCCQSMQSAGSPVMNVLSGLSLLDGLPLLQGNTQYGLNCVDLSAAGSGGTCEANSVCCNSTHNNGLVNVGCSPIVL